MAVPVSESNASQAAPIAASRNLANLDLMRGLAVLLVVSAHALEVYHATTGAAVHPVAWHIGRIGVLIFFVHTSLVLMSSLERSHASMTSRADAQDGGGSAIKKRLFVLFYIRRIFRIYPLAIAAILMMLVLEAPPHAWVDETPDFTTGELFANFFLYQNLTYSRLVLSPLWSLPLELQMYLCIPIIFIALRIAQSRKMITQLVWVLFSVAVALGVLQPLIPAAGRFEIFLFAPCFISGIVAHHQFRRAQANLPAIFWPILLLTLAGCYSALARLTGETHPSWVAWLFCLAIGCALPRFRELRQPQIRRAAEFVARYSYGIYLFHMAGLWLAWGATSPLDLGLPAAVTTFLLFTLVLPVVAYHAIEAPLIRLGRRVGRAASARLSEASAQNAAVGSASA